MSAPKKVYLASSWRNEPYYDQALRALRAAGFEVYDFKTANSNFKWPELDPDWEKWTPQQFVEALETDMSGYAFMSDLGALEECDICVLVLPAGNSAHLELGYAAGQRKHAITLVNPGFQPDLMLMVGHTVTSIDALLALLEILV